MNNDNKKYYIEEIRKHAEANYENGWDVVVEAYTDDEIVEAIKEATSVGDAVNILGIVLSQHAIQDRENAAGMGDWGNSPIMGKVSSVDKWWDHECENNRKYYIEEIRKHAQTNYGNGWDVVVKTYSDDDIVKAIKGATSVGDAINILGIVLGQRIAQDKANASGEADRNGTGDRNMQGVKMVIDPVLREFLVAEGLLEKLTSQCSESSVESLGSAFDWSYTKEGHDFWSGVLSGFIRYSGEPKVVSETVDKPFRMSVTITTGGFIEVASREQYALYEQMLVDNKYDGIAHLIKAVHHEAVCWEETLEE